MQCCAPVVELSDTNFVPFYDRCEYSNAGKDAFVFVFFSSVAETETTRCASVRSPTEVSMVWECAVNYWATFCVNTRTKNNKKK